VRGVQIEEVGWSDLGAFHFTHDPAAMENSDPITQV
jgi:hypothetical protein